MQKKLKHDFNTLRAINYSRRNELIPSYIFNYIYLIYLIRQKRNLIYCKKSMECLLVQFQVMKMYALSVILEIQSHIQIITLMN